MTKLPRTLQLDALIAQLEASLGVAPGAPLPVRSTGPVPQVCAFCCSKGVFYDAEIEHLCSQLDTLIAQLEASLGLAAGESLVSSEVGMVVCLLRLCDETCAFTW